jgi:hypothetical protein
MLTFSSGSVGKDELLKFANTFPVSELDDSLR